MIKVRIQKVLARAGVASRRAVEQMVLEGRITVNGAPATKLPCFVDIEADDIRVDGKRVGPAVRRGGGRGTRKVYLLLNKPRGVVCTQRDPAGRPRAVDLIGPVRQRVYCVGRLDVNTTGLVILTNDGELTDYLTHPRYGVEKTYVAEIDGRLDGDDLAKLRKGAYLDGKRTRGAEVKVLRRGQVRSLLRIRLAEGRNREIRRILARLGHKVRRLKRVAIGPVTDRGLKTGNFRVLNSAEVAGLRRSGKKHPKRPAAEPGGRGGGRGEAVAT